MLRVTAFIFMVYALVSCKKRSEYERLIEKELSSSEVNDSLFVGLSFGMDKQFFFDYSKDLNQKGVFTAGPSGYTIEYKIKEQTKYPIRAIFYPDFENKKLSALEVTYVYLAWSPWNKTLQADYLIIEIIDLYKKWFGEDFIEVTNEEGKTAYVRVDGNREIRIYESINGEVLVDYKNLRKD